VEQPKRSVISKPPPNPPPKATPDHGATTAIICISMAPVGSYDKTVGEM
jgi:hypothetical protein